MSSAVANCKYCKDVPSVIDGECETCYNHCQSCGLEGGRIHEYGECDDCHDTCVYDKDGNEVDLNELYKRLFENPYLLLTRDDPRRIEFEAKMVDAAEEAAMLAPDDPMRIEYEAAAKMVRERKD